MSVISETPVDVTTVLKVAVRAVARPFNHESFGDLVALEIAQVDDRYVLTFAGDLTAEQQASILAWLISATDAEQATRQTLADLTVRLEAWDPQDSTDARNLEQLTDLTAAVLALITLTAPDAAATTNNPQEA